MTNKPTYEELEQRVKELEKEFVERKRIEERLEEREQTLQALLNAPTETAILVDLEGTTLAINEIAAKRVGKNLDELIGLGLFEYLPRDVAASRKAKGDEVVRSGNRPPLINKVITRRRVGGDRVRCSDVRRSRILMNVDGTTVG